MISSKYRKYLLYFVWLVALIATLSSLFVSEVLHYIPCSLCWYQRILMYPLIWIIAAGIIKQDKHIPFFVLPLSTLGMIVALYHILLQYNLLPITIPCGSIIISCAAIQLRLFGFLTIPMMSFIAFTIITLCMIQLHRFNQTKK